MADNDDHNQHGVLRRIEQNDPRLTGVRVASDQADFPRLGKAIGANTRLDALEVDMLREERLPDPSFFEGIGRSSSIRRLKVCGECCRGEGYARVLNAVAEKRILTKLDVERGDRGNGGIRVLVSTIRKCKNLKCISVRFSRLGDEQLGHLGRFVAAVRGLRQVEEINLGFNRIGSDGCKVLAALLDGPNSNLRTLLLGNNRIDDNGTLILSNALVQNTKLERLNLENNNNITGKGLNSFLRVMCNTSSINSIYSSNHTLKDIGIPTRALSMNLFINITLNHGMDKHEVAQKKIIWKWSHFDMEPFFRYDMKMLPLVIDWFHRISTYGTNHEGCIIYVIYQFIRAMPGVFEPGPCKRNVKRKRRSKRKRIDMEGI